MQVSKLVLAVKNMLEENLEDICFGLMLYAGHGMIRDGVQCILLNQYSKKSEFYMLHSVERDIRYVSELCKNAYLVGIFACCREIFIPKIHCACVKATDVTEAKLIFEEKEKTE